MILVQASEGESEASRELAPSAVCMVTMVTTVVKLLGFESQIKLFIAHEFVMLYHKS